MLIELAKEHNNKADSVMVTASNLSKVNTSVSSENSSQASSIRSSDLSSGKEVTVVEREISTPTSESSECVVDIEKAVAQVSALEPDVPETLPEKRGLHGQRWLRHRAFILYRRFFSVVVLVNLAVAGFILYRKIGQGKRVLADLATATASNLCMAVLMRSEPVVNLLFTVFCSVPTCLPLAIRRHCARIFHIGGIHSACAIAATLFFSIFTITATVEIATATSEGVSTAVIVLSYMIMALLVAIGSLSHPTIRAKPKPRMSTSRKSLHRRGCLEPPYHTRPWS